MGVIVNILAVGTACAPALNTPVPYCWRVLSELWPRCVTDMPPAPSVGLWLFLCVWVVELQSLGCVIILSIIPSRWPSPGFHYFASTDNAAVNALERGSAHSCSASTSVFWFRWVTFPPILYLLLVIYLMFRYLMLCVKKVGTKIQGPTHQLFFQGLGSLTQLPPPDELPSCGQSSAL